MYDHNIHVYFNSFPKDKILKQSRFKVVADDKIIVTQRLKFVLGRIENIAGKGENAGFKKISFPAEVLKVGIVW